MANKVKEALPIDMQEPLIASLRRSLEQLNAERLVLSRRISQVRSDLSNAMRGVW